MRPRIWGGPEGIPRAGSSAWSTSIIPPRKIKMASWISARLTQAEQEAKAKAAKFSANHDELDRELQQSQSQQSKKLADSPSVSSSAGATAAARASKSDRTDAAISAYRSLTALQKRMSSLDGRIRNQQDLAGVYGQWISLVSARERGLLHSLLLIFGLMLLILLAILIADQFMDHIFNRLEPDQRKLLTLRAVAHIATRA